MILSQSRPVDQVGRRFPFLKNFPFSEFEMEVGNLTGISSSFGEDDEAPSIRINDAGLIRFTYKGKSDGKISVVIFEQELNWIHSIADQVNDLDKIAKTLNKGIRSKNLLTKRDAVEAAEKWCEAVQDNRSRLSYSTLGEVLNGLITGRSQLVKVIGKLSALSLKKGLVSLTEEEYRVILTYYHFQLVYTKLILGIVIASKISI
jgi:hypothetical protein